jgi:hypothetical protein
MTDDGLEAALVLVRRKHLLLLEGALVGVALHAGSSRPSSIEP